MPKLPSVVLLLTLCSTSLIVPNLAPLYSQTSPANSATQAKQNLLGTWETKEDEISLTFIFAPDGKLFILAPAIPNQKRTATELQYEINSVLKPMHLDVFLPRRNKPVQTIFEYTVDGKMRMQLEGTDPGVPRPTQFKNNGTIFEKNFRFNSIT